MSIVEKMARAMLAAETPGGAAKWDRAIERALDEDGELPAWMANQKAKAQAALTATGLTEAQLEGLANGTMVVIDTEALDAAREEGARQEREGLGATSASLPP